MVKTSRFILKMIMPIVMVLLSFNHLGAAQVLLTPELIVGEEYNDNIFLDPDNEEDDFITFGGLGLLGQITWRTAGLELRYVPTYHAFADHDELDYWRHEGRFLFWNSIGRNTRWQVTNDFLQTSDPTDAGADIDPDDPAIDSPIETDINRRGRNEYRTNIAEARIDHQFGPNNNVYALFRYGLLRDIDTPPPGEALDDYDEYRPAIGLEYWFAQRWSIELEGYYSDRSYDERNDREEYYGLFRMLHAFNRHVSGLIEYSHTEVYFDRDFNPGADLDYIVYQPAVGVRYQFQDTGRITAAVGYLFQDVKDLPQDEDDDEGWILNSELYKRWNFRSSYIDLVGGSGYQVADRGTEDLGLNIYYTGRLTLGYNFTSRLSGNVYGAYRYDDYPDAAVDRNVDTIETGAALNYQLLQWMNVNLNYRYRDLSSDIEQDEYTENRVQLIFTMTPATPFRWN